MRGIVIEHLTLSLMSLLLFLLFLLFNFIIAKYINLQKNHYDSFFQALLAILYILGSLLHINISDY